MKYMLTACFLGNICAKNCRNRTVYVQIIASQRWGRFLRHSVYVRLICCKLGMTSLAAYCNSSLARQMCTSGLMASCMCQLTHRLDRFSSEWRQCHVRVGYLIKDSRLITHLYYSGRRHIMTVFVFIRSVACIRLSDSAASDVNEFHFICHHLHSMCSEFFFKNITNERIVRYKLHRKIHIHP